LASTISAHGERDIASLEKGIPMKNMLHEETPMRGEFPHYRKPRRRRTERIVTFVILIPIIFVLIIEGLGVAFRMLNPTPIRTTRETRAFNLGTGTQLTLIVTNVEGFVHVRPGTGNTVTITATKIGDSYGVSPDDFKVSYSQSDNTVTIQVSNGSLHPFDFLNTSRADLEVTLPVKSDLHLETGSGDISVTGMQGKMTLTSNSGALLATNVSLTSGSHLRTGSGSMVVRGSIDTSGQYMFQSNSGDIDVSLPRSTSFHADLVSNSGTITNDFPIASVHQTGSYGRMVSGDVGISSQATVTIQSDSGSLHLRQM
jgi:Putative adhesin